ncbi:hypothetical protein E5288_WYG001987 [Bos mutus]|uniref:Cullin-5 n=1 Tax=Bos mutus TaxID=72004 RepID=A0A6B0RMI5_9CETA|nr:hypothetical protein [Bos mutus]
METIWIYQFRLIVIGDSTVGKSCLLHRFTQGRFPGLRSPACDPTVGVDFFSRLLEIEPGKRIKLQLWDTAGQERFRSITRSYYRNSVGGFLVFDITNRRSFEHVKDWLEEAKMHVQPFQIVFLLVGHKCDLASQRQVTREEAEKLSADCDLKCLSYPWKCKGDYLKNKGSLQFEDKWDFMRPIVLKLLRQESVTKQQWFDLFSDVHAVCLWDDKGPAKIHQALKEDILEFIKQAQARVLSHQDDTALLKAYIVEWRKFFTQCDILPKPFCQLEITLMGKQGSNKKSNVEDSIVRKLMLDTWNESIFSNIKNRLQDSAMKLVHAERLGEAFDSQLVIGVRESYVNLCSNPEDKLQIYRDNFEKAYLDSTERFYRTQAPSYLQQNGVQNYMKYADAKLKEEEKRALRYLETRRECNSVEALMECCVNALVTSFKETILAECQGMIKRNETEKLHLMFSLMDKVPNGIEPMLKDLEEHIISAGLADMVAAAETITTDSEKYVEQLLTLFNRFSKLVKEAFQDDPRFLTARDKAYKAVVNDATIFKLELPLKQKGVGLKTQPESKCPELLANYCDMLLRKTPLSKKLTSEEIEAKLKEVLLVLKYVQNKDVFMRYHKAHLTRRLILDISADSEIEENMVEWLREVGMPADYVNKLARMFQDIKVSEDLNQAFKEMHKNNKLALPADSVNIKILNAGAWSRSSEKVFVSLPTELEDLIPEVEEFYKKNHSGRKLHWHHLMSNGIITFKNEVGQYDLEVTTFQLAVLFAWNQRPREKISFENLKLATELPDAELRRTLWSLVAFPKLKRQVLLYEPQVNSPKDFTEGTLFSVNQEFSLIKNAKVQKRGKINLIGRLQLTTERMREEENEGIVQLRILRTQKCREQLKQLTATTIQRSNCKYKGKRTFHSMRIPGECSSLFNGDPLLVKLKGLGATVEQTKPSSKVEEHGTSSKVILKTIKG